MNNLFSNNNESCLKNPWIELLLKEFNKEVEDLSLCDVVTLRDNARGLIWHMCRHFGLSYRVAGNASRIFERYVAALVRMLKNNGGSEYESYVMNIVNPQLSLIGGCCFLLAAKSSNAKAGVTYAAIRNYFAKRISGYSIYRICNMEMEIFRRIGFHLPLFTCMDIAEMLATDIAVPPLTIRLAVAFAESAEGHRHFIQQSLLSVDYKHRTQARDRNITTLHLAASCVVAAVESDLGLSAAALTADHLSLVLKLCRKYLRTLSRVILVEEVGIKPDG